MSSPVFPPVIETARLLLKKPDPNFDPDRAADWASGEFYDYAIAFENVCVGNVGVHAINRATDVGELGYRVSPAFAGRGFATEAAGALTEVCFAQGLARIEIRCTPNNRTSARIAERLGFTLEACLRDQTVDADGVRRDTLIFAKLAGRDTPRPEARPDNITHYAEHATGEESPYPNSTEVFGTRASLSRALAVEGVEVDHLSLAPGRRAWRPGDPGAVGALVFVVDGACQLLSERDRFPMVSGDAGRVTEGFTLFNPGPADVRVLLVRAKGK